MSDSTRCGVLAVTGGGSLAISDLLTTPGASRVVLEALVPYSLPALVELLQHPVEQACSARTARAMAMACFWRAWRWQQPTDRSLSDEESDELISRLWGVACTASLRTDRPKRGDHRCHIAVQTATTTQTYSLVLKKEARSRADEERLVADLVLRAVDAARALPLRELPPLLEGEQLECTTTEADPDWQDVVLGRIDAVSVGGVDGDASEPEPSSSHVTAGAASGEASPALEHSAGLVFPGAFHPIHHGHRGMARWVETKFGRPVEFEISVENVDKPSLDYTEIAERLKQFAPNEVVWLTRAATFVEKARIFPGATFIVGADTAQRLGETRYYASREARDAAIAEIARLGCRLLVFARKVGGRLRTLDELDIPDELRAICTGVDPEEFREDISSTELRAAQSPED